MAMSIGQVDQVHQEMHAPLIHQEIHAPLIRRERQEDLIDRVAEVGANAIQSIDEGLEEMLGSAIRITSEILVAIGYLDLGNLDHLTPAQISAYKVEKTSSILLKNMGYIALVLGILGILFPYLGIGVVVFTIIVGIILIGLAISKENRLEEWTQQARRSFNENGFAENEGEIQVPEHIEDQQIEGNPGLQDEQIQSQQLAQIAD